MKFSQRVNHLTLQPSEYVKYLIDEREIGYLRDVKTFQQLSDILGEQEYIRALDRFIDCGKPMNFMKLFPGIMELEQPISSQLKTIAEDAVREIFGVPDYIHFDAQLEQSEFNEDLEEQFVACEITPQLQEEINKRILLNALVHGAAIHSWKASFYIIKDEIEALNSRLIPMYDKLTAMVSFMMFQVDGPNEKTFTNGVSCVNNDDEISIQASGNSLPVLLNEMVKGVVSLWMQHGIPNHLSEEEIMTLYAVADKYEDEYFHYILSPSLWENFLTATDVYPNQLAPIIAKFSQLSLEKIEQILMACVNNKSEAKILMKTYKII